MVQLAESPTLDITALKAQYEEEGYCIARGCFSPEEVSELHDLFERVQRDCYIPDIFEPVSKEESAGDPLKEYPRFVHPHRYFRRAQDYMLHPQVGAVLRSLMEAEPIAAQSMYYYKPPGARGQALHQDQLYLLVEPGTCVAAWTALDYCDKDNGGMFIVPKTQALETACPGKADEAESFTGHHVPPPKGARPVLAEMAPGDTLFFNGQMIHGSGRNRTKDRWRRSFICHYCSEATEKISKFYHPLYSFENAEVKMGVSKGGSMCGEEWEGLAH